jgi:hypothetical protein
VARRDVERVPGVQDLFAAVEATRQVILVVRAGDETAPRIAVAIDAAREVRRTWPASPSDLERRGCSLVCVRRRGAALRR